MPGQKSQSVLVQKYGNRARELWNKHRNDETDYGNFANLPAGIDNGVAQLTKCAIQLVAKGKPHAGEPYFIARAVVKKPETHDGVRCAGKSTQVIENLFDTPGRARSSFEEHLAWVSNFLRTLGCDTAEVELDELEETCAAVQEAAPHIEFRTWKGQKQETGPYAGKEPRVQESWMGLAEQYTEEEGAGTGDVDNTGPPEFDGGRTPTSPSRRTPTQSNGAPAGKATQSPPKPRMGGKVVQAPAPEPESGPEFGDLDSLAERASPPTDDAKAQDELRRLANEAGITDEQVDQAESWQAVADLISEGTNTDPGLEGGTEEAVDTGSEEGDVTEPEGKESPGAGSPVRYRPVDPKTKKPQKRAIECVVTAVNEAKGTADIRSLDNAKVVYKAVAWDDLEY
jgi:hypothetical protein